MLELDSVWSEVRNESVADVAIEDNVVDKLAAVTSASVDVALAALAIVAEAACERPANDVAMTLDATALAVRTAPSPLSILSKSRSPVGKNLVHHSAMRKPRSTKRCLRMNRTTKKKKQTAEIMSKRSSQSDFSRAVISCFEVPITASSVSCVAEVDRRVAVDESIAL